MRKIYHPYDIQQTSVTSLLVLSPQTSHHLTRVLRCNIGDQLMVFNGQNSAFYSVIKDINKRAVTIEITDRAAVSPPSPLKIHLCIALSQGKKFDHILKHSTELGVYSITPIISEYVNVKLDQEKIAKKTPHWNEIIINACEQSGNFQRPLLQPVQTLDNWLTSSKNDSLTLCLHPYAKTSLHATHTHQPILEDLTILIGPEGGFSDLEIQQLQHQNCQCITLGQRILRTETAPLAIISIAQYLWGDF
jgi:16S rRNA (uracil1498-N3)-methyltransferase